MALKSEAWRIINANSSTPTTYTRYDSASSNESAAYNYDILEFTGSNVVWDGRDDCRLAIEVKGVKYYQVAHTS
jgi:hypothetical protein